VAVTGDGDRPDFRRGLQLATRSAVSATLAYSIAQALKLDYPIFALAAAVIATDLTPARSRELGFRRLVATAIGGLSGALAASMNLVGIWAVGPSILIAMLICQGVGAYEGARIAGYICGIIVLLDNGDSPWLRAFSDARDRARGPLGVGYKLRAEAASRPMKLAGSRTAPARCDRSPSRQPALDAELARRLDPPRLVEAADRERDASVTT